MWSFNNPEFQLVFEFAVETPEEFERMAAIEETLCSECHTGEVDGNDIGGGVMNLFIITKTPDLTFEECMTFFNRHGVSPSAAGARKVNENDYTRFWPKGESSAFVLK